MFFFVSKKKISFKIAKGDKFAADCDWNGNTSQTGTTVAFLKTRLLFLKINFEISRKAKGDNLAVMKKPYQLILFLENVLSTLTVRFWQKFT